MGADGLGAGNVAVGIADDNNFAGLQIGQAGLAFGEGLAGDIVAIGGVAAKGACPWAERTRI